MATLVRYIVTPAGEVGSSDLPLPTGLTATAGDGQVALTWTAPSPATDVTDYAVQYRTSPSGAWTTVAHTASTATARTVTGLTNGTVYDFEVAAVRTGVTGTYTEPVSAAPAAAPGPSNLRATAGDGQVALTWTAPSPATDVTDYAVQYRVSPAGSWLTFAHTASTATSRTVTGLTNGTAYDFWVAAIRTGVVGVYTAGPVTATPKAPTTTTLFGINTNEKDTFNQTVAGRKAWFSNRVPVVRRYNSGFVPATWPITRAAAPEGRVAYSFKCDDRGGQFDAAALASGAGNARFKSLIESIPGGVNGMREVWLIFFHEANDDIVDHNAGPNAVNAQGQPNPYNGNKKHISHTEFKQVYAQLYPVIQNATLAPGVTVKLAWNFMAFQLTRQGTGPTDPNASFHDLWVPALGTAHAGTFDIYGNPGVNTSPSGSNIYGGPATGLGYGTTYPLPGTRFADMFAVLDRLRWKRWGILEFDSPARDWDTTEAGRAQWHEDAIELCLKRPTPPEIFLFWEAPSGANWDQSYGRVGPATAVVNAIKPYIVGTPVG